MGSLAPTTSLWIPADDVLLKNSVEAGASLEALAKGAVQFSRKYTLQELQTRWHALLYDPDTSESASAHMFELELSASKIPLQPNRVGDSKGNELPGKRKDYSVRSHYYATRKRIRAEPFSNVDVSFLDGPNCLEDVKIYSEHPSEKRITGEPAAAHFDLQGTEFAFRGHHQHPLQGELSDGIMGGNCLYEFPETIHHVAANKAIESDLTHSFEHYDMHNNIGISEGSHSGVQKMGPPRELPAGRVFETAKSFSELDPVNNNPVPVCPEFGQNKNFSSHISDCSGSFHQLYSSAVPTMPAWRTMEDICTRSSLIKENLDENIKGEGDGRQGGSSGYNDLHIVPQLEEGTCDGGLKDSRVLSERNCVGISNSLLNYPSEDLYMDVNDGKDMINRSYIDRLSSILLSSPTDIHQPSTAEVSSMAKDLGLILPEELDGMDVRLGSVSTACDSNIIIRSSTSAPNPHSPERQNGVICCAFNTEDPDIPCNDEVLLPIQVLPPIGSSTLDHTPKEGRSSSPPPTVDFSFNVVDNKQGLNYTKGEEFLAEPQFLPETYSNNPLPCGMPSDLPEGVSLTMPSEGVPTQYGSAHLSPYPLSAELKDDNAAVELGRFCTYDSSMDFLLDGSGQCSDFNENDPQNIITEYNKQEVILPGAIQNHLPAEHASFEMPLVNLSPLDQELQSLDDEDDVPHFSDIEAVILDMDLGPCDHDFYTQVCSRYQQEQAKRAILRLDQGVQSYMQRAIAAHGAFAVLYGRNLKHYIMKQEVSLGRATDGSVDIDLSKERRVTNISRRQAIIKMKEDGSFWLKNIGKVPLFVNGKKVAIEKSVKLVPGCLIEIRRMSFIFETNRKMVKQYLGAMKKQQRGSKIKRLSKV